MASFKLIVCMDPFDTRVFPLRNRRVSVGRSSDQDICIPDRKISSAHALLEPSEQGYRLRDLGSTNGTYVNDHLVNGMRQLQAGDEIRFGNTLALYTDRDPKAIDWPSVELPALSSLEEPDPLEDELGTDSELAAIAAGRQTVKFRLPDIERDLLRSDSGEEDLGSLHKRLQVLFRMTHLTRETGSASTLLDEALALVFEVIDADRGAFFLRDEPEGKLQGVALKSRKSSSRRGSPRRTETAGISRGILEQVLASGEAILTRDAQQDTRFSSNKSIYTHNIRSALAVPMRAQDTVLGVLHLDKRSARRPFDSQDMQLAVIVAQQAAASIANRRLFDDLSRTNQKLADARDEIMRWNQELEQKVKERTREVNAQAEKIAELNRQKDQLLGMVAHDLRTPLAGMLGFAEVAIAGIEAGLPSEDTLSDLNVIKQTAQEMSELLNDLLDVSRLEAGKIKIDPRPIDVAQLASEGRRRYELWAESKEIVFLLLTPESLRVDADPKRVRQILNNLISNAIKFSSQGGTITLRLRALDPRPEGRFAELSVSDTGLGIAPEDLDRVFAQYEQTKTRATAGEHGSGLGLSIAQKLVRLHGGEIWVESTPDVGTQFFFTLPLC